MRAIIKKYRYFLSALFFGALIYITAKVIFKHQSFAEIEQTIRFVNPLYLLIAIGMMGLYALFETINMYYLFRGLGQKLPFLRCFGYVYIGFYFSSITPASLGGQPMQMVYMSKDRIPVSVSSLVILLYFVVYQFVLLLFCGTMYIIRFPFLHLMLHSIRLFIIYGICASLFLIVSVLSVFLSKKTVDKIIGFAINVLSKIKIIKNKEKSLENANRQMDEYVRGVLYLRDHWKLVIKICVITFLQYMAFFSVPYFVYRSFGLNEYSYLDLVSAQSMIHLSSASLPLPGAVGAAENAFYHIFNSIYPSQAVMPAMILSRGISFYGFMIFSGVVTLIFHFHGIIAAKHNRLTKIDHSE